MRLSEDAEKFILDLVGRHVKDIVSKAAVDVLKALLLSYGSAWESELKDTLMGLWSLRGLQFDEVGELQSALADAEKLLSEKGAVEIDVRARGDLRRREPRREKFYTTKYLYLLMRVFSGDIEIDRFRYQMQQ
ncbi:MAG: hypothetical protein J7L83_02425 [Thaumarchaeota archaeon]|nr:hypothetical protein [Nitrososphaerota archaeon]